jgi:hypothetical protein
MEDTTYEELNSFIHGNTDLSILRLEEFLEDLEDRCLLNEKGIKLRNTLWELYIKDTKK